MSRSRSFYSIVVPTKNGGTRSIRRPNPIDISVILRYNHDIYGILASSDFLEIIQALDEIYLIKEYSRKD
jgi:hypothetical protein